MTERAIDVGAAAVRALERIRESQRVQRDVPNGLDQLAAAWIDGVGVEVLELVEKPIKPTRIGARWQVRIR